MESFRLNKNVLWPDLMSISGWGGGVVTRSHVHGGEGGGCCDQVPGPRSPPLRWQNDKHLWKHNLRSLRYAGGNNSDDISPMRRVTDTTIFGFPSLPLWIFKVSVWTHSVLRYVVGEVWIPQNHIWCHICRPLCCQHDSWSQRFPTYVFMHWWESNPYNYWGTIGTQHKKLRARLRCGCARDSVLIENSEVTWKWIANPFCSDSIVFNENRIVSMM